MMYYLKSYRHSALVPTLLLWTGTILSTPVTAAGSSEALIEEVLVYGTKRSGAEAVQDVPAQVAAYGSEQLKARHVINIEDLSFATPNVQLDGIGTQASYAAFSIRGLGVDNSTPSIDANVGVFVDGTYLGVPFGVITDTFDLESVEIYKGPQGLLFGRNVTGGAVLLRSRRPTGEFGVKAKAGIESGSQYVLGVAVEGSLIEDRLAVRFSAQRKDDDGWHDNKFLNKDTGASTTDVYRLSVVYTLSDSVEMTFIIEDGSMTGDGTPVQNLYSVPPIAPLDTNGQNTSSFPITPSNDSFNVSHDYVGIGDADWSQFTFETVVEVGAGTITNILSYREVGAFSSADVDGRETAAINTFYTIDQQQVTNELRYNITIQDDWDLTVGFSYFQQEYDYMTGLVVGAPDLDFDLSNGRGHRRGGGQLDQTSIALYINNEYRITDNFSLIGGINFSKEEKDVRIALRLPPASIVAAGLPVLATACDYQTGCDFSRAVPADDEWTNASPKVGFSWSLTDEALVYGHYSRAFRSGFFNFRQTNPALLVPGPNGNGPEATDVEEHNAIEFGIKSTFADDRIRLNMAYFNQDIENLARSTGFTLPDGNPAQDLINVGDARIAGFEVDVLTQVTDDFVVGIAAGYLDGDITDASADINRDGNQDSADESLGLVRLAQWTANLTLNYDLAISNLGVMSVSTDYGYRSSAAARDDNPAFFPKQNMINASILYTPNEGDWTFSIYGKNLRNDVIYKTLFPLSSGRNYAPIGEGRRYGIELSYEM